MNSTYYETFKSAFMADEPELRKIAELLTKRIGSIDITASCLDNVNRSFNSLNELMAYQNPKTQEIFRIQFSARSEDRSRSATIELSGRPSHAITINITARDDVVTKLRSEVLTTLEGMHVWYNGLVQVDFTRVATATYSIAVFAILLVGWRVSYLDESIVAGFRLTLKSWATFLLALPLTLMALGAVVNRIRNHLFPEAVFLIGQGVKRQKTLSYVQWTVVVGLVVSFVGSLLVYFVTT